MKKIKYGLIGFGGIAENRIAKEGFACDRSRFLPLKKAELAGACDLNPERRKAAEALGLKWYDSVDDLLADKEIEAVFIATGNSSHVPLALRAFAAGKHVFSEKPMATKEEDALKAIETAEKCGLSYTVDHMMVYNAFNKKAARLTQSGKLGTVNDCCFHMECITGNSKGWRCADPAEMGGPIGDMGSHCFYMAEFITGKKITQVAASFLPKLMPINAEDGAYIAFFFEDGTRGSVKVAFSEPRGGMKSTISNLGYEIYGSSAVLRSYGTMFQLSGHEDEIVRQRLEIDRFDGKVKSVQPGKIQNIYQSIIENHAASISRGTPLNCRDGYHNFLLCKAAYQSAENGGKIISIKE